VNDRVASGDVGVELVQRDRAEVLEVLLDLHLDIVAREVRAQSIAVVAKLVRNRRQENPDRHGGRPASRERLTLA
jgi:hypothetical protein